MQSLVATTFASVRTTVMRTHSTQTNIHECRGGPRFPIAHALRFCRVAVALHAHMPAVHTEITIWGVKGGSPPFFWAKSYFSCYLERNAKIQNRRQISSGRKVSGRKEKERKKKNNKLS